MKRALSTDRAPRGPLSAARRCRTPKGALPLSAPAGKPVRACWVYMRALVQISQHRSVRF
nr:MAG TPA: hypothetical protein [Caudoviricetes sp.]